MSTQGTHSYRQTIRAHRLLLALPPIIATVIAGAIVLSAGKQYKSSASMWINNPPAVGSSLIPSQLNATDPASQEATVLVELLSTQSFATAVGDQSLLRSYLETHGSGNQIEVALLKNLQSGVSNSTPGPNSMKISYTGPTPAVTESVVNAVVSQLQKSSALLGASYAATELKYYHAQ